MNARQIADHEAGVCVPKRCDTCRTLRKLEGILPAVTWIAENDEPTWTNVQMIADQITVQLLAYEHSVEPRVIAEIIVTLRKKEPK